jgi:site-specific recombinase XerC
VRREAERLEFMTVAVCVSACSCPGVKRAREPDGRRRNGAELTALLGACDRATPACVCDAALLGVAYGAGLSDERVLLTLTSIDLATGAIQIIVKGRQKRMTYAPTWLGFSMSRSPARMITMGELQLSSDLRDG